MDRYPPNAKSGKKPPVDTPPDMLFDFPEPTMMTDQPQPSPEKKIYIDEDWKSKVQAEKEQAERAQAGPQETPSPQDLPDTPLPPPTLTLLATTLGMQAVAALGLEPDPLTGKTDVRLNQARHLIDMIQMLQDKTAGNRTPEETSALDHLLHELRMGYLAVSQKA